jgi:hypothetical protein
MTLNIFSDDRLQSKDIDTLKRHLRWKLGGYKVMLADIRADNLLYRGVVWKRRPTRVDQVSYPPAEKVATLGRVNRVGKSVFYCSRAAPAVFYELKARRGDLIALSEWGLIEPLWMHNLGYHRDALRKIGTPDLAARPRLTYPIPQEPREN